jgi:hypothetical protein
MNTLSLNQQVFYWEQLNRLVKNESIISIALMIMVFSLNAPLTF